MLTLGWVRQEVKARKQKEDQLERDTINLGNVLLRGQETELPRKGWVNRTK